MKIRLKEPNKISFDVFLSVMNLTFSISHGAVEPGISAAAEPSITVCRHFGV